jgi:hypothetical protein
MFVWSQTTLRYHAAKLAQELKFPRGKISFKDDKISAISYRNSYFINLLPLSTSLGFHGRDYEKFRLLGYKTQFVIHGRHINSP